jgi:hypothetical protein
MTKLRVIIGRGTAAEVFRATRPSEGYLTILLGERGLWATQGPKRRMGQPPHLLALPKRPIPAFQVADGRTRQGLRRFIDVQSYQSELEALSLANDYQALNSGGFDFHLQNCTVQSVSRSAGKMVVQTQNPALTIEADQVIIASGIGPQRKPDFPYPNNAPLIDGKYPRIVEGLTYLRDPGPDKGHVMVYGGGATAAWIADLVYTKCDKMLWAARSNFDPAQLPGNRNYMILQAAREENLMRLGTVKGVSYVEPAPLSCKIQALGVAPADPKLFVYMTLRSGQEVVYTVDQFIYALGGDQDEDGAIRRLLSPNLLNSIRPMYDKNRVLGGSDGVLAWATEDEKLLIIGASTYNFTPSNVTPKAVAPMSSLPRNAQVPDGIAMIIASVAAMNNFIPIQQSSSGQVLECKLNLNTCDRNQLAAYLTIFHEELSPLGVESVVAEVISYRSDPWTVPVHAQGRNDFGITDEQFLQIVANAAALFPAAP